MITHDDLNWWLETAAQVEWIWAKTYAETAPHSYVVEGRTDGLTHEDYVRAGRVIHTFGQPAKFYGMTNIYLTSPDGHLKWWTMDPDVRSTGLINQATTERLYGVQNAPVTASGIDTPYDAVATWYDERHPTTEALAKSLREAVDELTGDYPPAVLDVGCGTGRVLDLGLTRPDRYAGIDSSTPMLNQLVRKHPGVAGLYPMRVEQTIDHRVFTPGQFEIVTVILRQAGELGDHLIRAVQPLASRGLILAVGDQVNLHTVTSVSAAR